MIDECMKPPPGGNQKRHRHRRGNSTRLYGGRIPEAEQDSVWHKFKKQKGTVLSLQDASDHSLVRRATVTAEQTLARACKSKDTYMCMCARTHESSDLVRVDCVKRFSHLHTVC